MESTTRYNVTLKKSEETRLDQVFMEHCDDAYQIHLQQFLILAFKKGLVGNSCPLHAILNVFNQAADKSGTLSKNRFYFAINLLARQLYPDHPSPIDGMLTSMLAEKEGSAGKTPVQDELTDQLLQALVIREFENCEEGCQRIFINFLNENIKAKRTVVGWREIAAKGKGILARNFLRYLRASNIIPNLMNIEGLQDTIAAVIVITTQPPSTKSENEFYERCVLIREYEKEAEVKVNIPVKEIEGEPLLLLPHFMMVLGRIALETLRDLSTPERMVFELFETKLGLGRGQRLGPGAHLPYQGLEDSDEDFSSEEEVHDVRAVLERKQLTTEDPLTGKKYDIGALITQPPEVPTDERITEVMEKYFVPKFPEPPKIEPRDPNLPVIEIPLPKPKTPPDKKKMAAPVKAPSANKGKKEESAADSLKFAPLAGTRLESLPSQPRHEEFREFTRNLTGSLFPETGKQSLVNPGVQPCIIREILLPPPSPQSVSTLIESAFVYQNSGNYPQAYKALEDGKSEWQEIEGTYELKAEHDLFFDLSKGAIFESCGMDELALGQYIISLRTADRLEHSHPDKAIVWCGLGSALYHLGKYPLSLRAFLKAKEIREMYIGGDTVDTATVYNNLGVCMYFLMRYQESFAYFQLSEAILDTILGPHHPRTLTVPAT